ncbi:MAG TPA: PAS domain S-box protein [Lacunisphaera sp.]|jgi:PAS domain S-box-containing protein|nr:PAS domain S-box protein [Lacunisphaera sp.]
MTKEIQIIIVEDMPADVVLINHHLRKGGLAFKVRRVATADEFLRSLRQGKPDLIISDHGLPEFDGFSALEMARRYCPEVPFLFVTGSMGEEVAVESLRRGATDYVLKSRLENLVPAVLRALKLAGEQRRRREAEQALVESEDQFRALIQGVKDYAIFMLDADGHVTTWNSGLRAILGYRAEEILGRSHLCLYPPEEVAAGTPGRLLQTAEAEGHIELHGWRLRQDGSRFLASSVITALHGADGGLRGFTEILRDETERRRAEEDLRRSEARHTAILESAHDAILSIDHEGFIREWNAAARRLFQYSREDAVGRRFDALIGSKALQERYPDGVMRHLIGGDARAMEHPLELMARRADGSEFPVEVSLAPMGGAVPPLYAAVLRDVSMQNAAVAEIARLNSELEERVRHRTAQLETANQELESFSYTVSHDLRAPLRHITGFVDMLQSRKETQLDAEGREMLGNIAAAAERMTRLIEALLSLSRTGRADLVKQRVPLARLVRAVQDELRGEAHGRQVNWHIGRLPEVEGDADLLRQVFVNLLSNALKYTRRAHPAEIRVESHREAGEHLFAVRDNGVGFDPRFMDKLFGVFQRLHRSSEFEGTGIGLATVRLIVQRHGGRVWAESGPGGGATFHFSLPAHGRSHHE